jgi:FKBP-type peptidyl-prolyl cis-trans isomerase
MHKTIKTIPAAILFVFALIAVRGAQAQQTPAASATPAAPAKTPQTPAAKPKPAQTSSQTPSAKTAQAPAAKTGQAPATKSGGSMALTTQKEKASYAIGMNIGAGLHKDSVDVDPNILAQGLKDGMSGAKPQLTDEEMKAALTALQAEVQKKQEAKIEVDKKLGEEFLAANKTKEGVVTLPSGLQYKILKEGTGAKPTAADTVLCNYRGTLVDGTEFDSSYKRGEPATFGVGQVIHGWTEALQLMPVGSKWQLFVPSDLAYGPRGRPGIEPNAMLIFEVELLSIQGKDANAK